MTIRNELIDELLAGRDPASVMRQDGLLGELRQALLNRLMAAEFDHHMEQERASGEGRNHRNGATRKRVLTGDGHVEVTIPRDREAHFEPVLIGKYQRRLPGFNDKVISLYARGMSTREIQGHLEELYGAEVSPTLISTVTDAVSAEAAEWQSRPLEPLYPVVFFDAIRVKVRDEGVVRNKAVYLALGVTPDGRKEVLGLWIESTDGAKFWLRIVNELRNRGVNDILIAVVDGLKGFPEAINAAFPQTLVQTCIMHLLRTSLAYVAWADGREVVAALKPVYVAPDRRGGTPGAGCLRDRVVGREVSRHRPGLAAAMAAGGAVLRLPTGGAPDHLHHQCHREPQQQAAQLRAQSGALPIRRGGNQTVVFGLARCRKELDDATARVDRCQDTIRYPVRRPVQP